MAQKAIKPIVDAEKTIGSNTIASILTGIRAIPEVIVDENGKRKTTNKILGYAYDCVSPAKKYASFSVKILGQKTPLFSPDEEVPDDIQVIFTGLTGTLYVQTSGSYHSVAISFKADKVEVLHE